MLDIDKSSWQSSIMSMTALALTTFGYILTPIPAISSLLGSNYSLKSGIFDRHWGQLEIHDEGFNGRKHWHFTFVATYCFWSQQYGNSGSSADTYFLTEYPTISGFSTAVLEYWWYNAVFAIEMCIAIFVSEIHLQGAIVHWNKHTSTTLQAQEHLFMHLLAQRCYSC